MMFPQMRRYKQALPPEDCRRILTQGTSGILALSGGDGYPYAVPLSYVYHNDHIYFHSAVSGHKLDLLRANPKASFCVIDQDQVVPAEYTTYFRSVIVFGTLRELSAPAEKRAALRALAVKYDPENTPEGHEAAMGNEARPICMLELTVDHMTGKEAKELARQRNGE